MLKLAQRIESNVLQRVLTGIQALRDAYEANVNKTLPTKANSVSDQIIQLKGKTNILERTVEETRSELSDLEDNTSSRFTQTSRGIALEVERATKAEGELSGRISLSAQSIELKLTEGETSAGIKIVLKNEDGEEIDSKDGNIKITGMVTFDSLSAESSKTFINGGNIITGTLKVSQIEDAEKGTITFYNINCYELRPSYIYECQSISTDTLYLYDTEAGEEKNVSDWINSVQNGVDQINSNLSDWDLEARVSELERMVASVGLLKE